MEEVAPGVNEYIKELTEKISRLESKIGSVRGGARFDPNIDPNKAIRQIDETTHKWVFCRDGMWRALKRTDDASKRLAIEKMVSTKATKKAALQEILDAPVKTVPVEPVEEKPADVESTPPAVEPKQDPPPTPDSTPLPEPEPEKKEDQGETEVDTVPEEDSETDGEELDEAIRKHVSQTKQMSHSVFGSNYREE